MTSKPNDNTSKNLFQTLITQNNEKFQLRDKKRENNRKQKRSEKFTTHSRKLTYPDKE